MNDIILGVLILAMLGVAGWIGYGFARYRNATVHKIEYLRGYKEGQRDAAARERAVRAAQVVSRGRTAGITTASAVGNPASRTSKARVVQPRHRR